METLNEKKQYIQLASEMVRKWKLSEKWMKVIFLIIQNNFKKSSPGKHENHSKNHNSVSLTSIYHSVWKLQIMHRNGRIMKYQWVFSFPLFLSFSFPPHPLLPLQKIVLISTHYLLYFPTCWVVLIPLNKIRCLLQLDITINSKKVAKDKICVKHVSRNVN